jgi:hypothetical protein
MSVKTRLEALEKRLAKPEPEETVIRIREIVVHNTEEIEQLRAAGLLDSRQDSGRSVPRGSVRLVIEEAVDAKDVLANARAVSMQDEGQEGSDAAESWKTPSGARANCPPHSRRTPGSCFVAGGSNAKRRDDIGV